MKFVKINLILRRIVIGEKWVCSFCTSLLNYFRLKSNKRLISMVDEERKKEKPLRLWTSLKEFINQWKFIFVKESDHSIGTLIRLVWSNEIFSKSQDDRLQREKRKKENRSSWPWKQTSVIHAEKTLLNVLHAWTNGFIRSREWMASSSWWNIVVVLRNNESIRRRFLFFYIDRSFFVLFCWLNYFIDEKRKGTERERKASFLSHLSDKQKESACVEGNKPTRTRRRRRRKKKEWHVRRLF